MKRVKSVLLEKFLKRKKKGVERKLPEWQKQLLNNLSSLMIGVGGLALGISGICEYGATWIHIVFTILGVCILSLTLSKIALASRRKTSETTK